MTSIIKKLTFCGAVLSVYLMWGCTAKVITYEQQMLCEADSFSKQETMITQRPGSLKSRNQSRVR